MSLKELRNDKRYLNININGNKKLKNTDNLHFIIWNLPAVKTCPFATAHCVKSCYARKAERVYPNVLKAREKNLADSKSADFVSNMIFTLSAEVEHNAKRGLKPLCAFMKAAIFTQKIILLSGLKLRNILIFSILNKSFLWLTQKVLILL